MEHKSILDKFIDPCITSLPKCMICKNFIDDGNNNEVRCKAFPNGIPDDVIWEDDEKECNNGIYFEEE